MAKVKRTGPKVFIPIQITLETAEEALVLLAHLNDPLITTKEYLERNVRDGKGVFDRAVASDANYRLFCDLDDELGEQGYLINGSSEAD